MQLSPNHLICPEQTQPVDMSGAVFDRKKRVWVFYGVFFFLSVQPLLRILLQNPPAECTLTSDVSQLFLTDTSIYKFSFLPLKIIFVSAIFSRILQVPGMCAVDALRFPQAVSFFIPVVFIYSSLCRVLVQSFQPCCPIFL